MAEWETVENRAGDFGARMISRNGVFSSSPVDIAELAVERRHCRCGEQVGCHHLG
jgi:hypothetical protein